MQDHWVNHQRLLGHPRGLPRDRCSECGAPLQPAMEVDGHLVYFCETGCRSAATGLPVGSIDSSILRRLLAGPPKLDSVA